MQPEQSILDRIQRRQLKLYGHCTVGGEEDDRNNHGGTKRRTSCRAETWNKIWQKIDIFGVWEWMDGSWLYIYI